MTAIVLKEQAMRVVITLGCVLLLSACVGEVKKDLPAETIVKERASERWKLLIEGRFESVYKFQTPEYRKVFSFKQFRRGFGGLNFWTKAEVENVICTEECIATVKVYVRIKPGRWGEVIESSQIMKEKWVRSTNLNEWFYLSSN